MVDLANQPDQSDQKPPGVLSLLLSVGMLALGVWRLVGGRALSTFGYVWAIALVVIGALGVLAFLLGRIAKAAGPVGPTPEDAADKILGMQKRMYSGERHEIRPASLAEFPRADVGFYDRMRDLLSREGFRCLGDVEDVTLTREFPKMRTPLRTLVGDSGTVVAAVYHLRMSGWIGLLSWVGLIPRHVRAVEFETGFDDGTFISTENGKEVNPTMPIPGITSNRLPAATDPLELLRLHRETVRQVMAADPARRPVVCHSLVDVNEFQHRMHVLKCAHRQKVGYTNAAEMAAIQGRALNPHEQEVAAAIERARTAPGSRLDGGPRAGG